MKIHYFNPGHETAVLNKSPYYMAPSNVVAMQQELAFLPAWYANADDRIFVWDELNNEYWKYIYDNLNGVPQIITKDDLKGVSAEVCLWGISPQAIHFWSEIGRLTNAQIEVPIWKNEYFDLTSRRMAKDCLSYIITALYEIDSALLPIFCLSLTEIEELVKDSSCQLLAKAPYSSSGRGLLWLPISELSRTERQILHGILKKQGTVSVERALNKQIDFAMEFMSDGVGNVTFSGYSLFETNAKGAYSANILDSQVDLRNKITSFVDPDLLDKICKLIEVYLSNKYGELYKGCIGVDMMIYMSDNGEYKIHPCVEINMRYNMGFLSLQFYHKHVEEGRSGRFYIDFLPREGEIHSQHLKLVSKYPPEVHNNKLVKGYFPLCPVDASSHYWAYVLID